SDTSAPAKALDSTLAAVAEGPTGGGFRPGGPPPPTFAGVNGTLGRQLNALETGDLAPTAAMQAAYLATCKDLGRAVARWTAIVAQNHLKPPAAGPLAAPRCEGENKKQVLRSRVRARS